MGSLRGRRRGPRGRDGGADANERRDAGAHAGKEEDERGGYVVTASGVGTPIDDADEEN